MLLLTILHQTESHKVLPLIQFQLPKGTEHATIIVTNTNNYHRRLPLCYGCTPIPVRNHAQEDIYQVLGILSQDLLPHAEQEQQTYSVSVPKTRIAVSIFLEVEQQLYSQVYFPLSVKIINVTNKTFVVNCYRQTMCYMFKACIYILSI